MSFFTPHDTAVASSGTKLILSWPASTATVGFYISNIVLANTNPGAGNAQQIDVAHLGQTTGELAARLTPPLVVPADDGGSGRQMTFDYIGRNYLHDGSTGTYVIAVAGVNIAGGLTGSFYTVQSSTLTLATNDAIRGQGVLTLAR